MGCTITRMRYLVCSGNIRGSLAAVLSRNVAKRHGAENRKRHTE